MSVAFVACSAAMAVAGVARDIPYAPENGRFGLGDLYLPESPSSETPVVLTIHGGGWTAGDRYSWSGVAEFFWRDLGCAVFNIEYRLASAANRWPACGNDCLNAANWLFSEDFRKRAGFSPKKIWICGGSAGGHLTLWAALNLPPDKVAGAVSISGIADAEPDRNAHSGRYRWMTGDGIPEANPLKMIQSGGPRLLLTHAVGDKVVPVESERNFAASYRAAGNVADVFEYPCNLRPGLTGHCIWIPGSKPHRLIPEIESRIAAFMGRKSAPPYVPEPQPAKSDMEITALYYPGTEHMPEWDIVRRASPSRRPLLGWYDERDPVNVDWQIKWAVEHGISSFCVCWYWNMGEQRLDHWVKAYYRSRYRKYLKWYVMYANHNQPGAHSSEDQAAVTKFWIDNYFKTPEYYTIDEKPVVVYCTSKNLDRDFIEEAKSRGENLKPGEGIRRAFDISDRMAKEAGLSGIFWVNMNWLLGDGDWDFSAEHRDMLRRAGFSAEMTYNLGGQTPYKRAPAELRTPEDRQKRARYDLQIAAALRLAEHADDYSDVPFWPAIPTGYDDKSRSFQRGYSIYGRTPEKFRAACAAIKDVCRRKGLKRVVVSPLNEWQEGSYIEPNEEYGFAMYDALRDVFCEKPKDGWPSNLVPQDIGMPLHEFPPMFLSPVQRWTFDSSTEGWYRQPFGAPTVTWNDGTIRFITTRIGNYNIRQRMLPFDASRYGFFKVRMRITPNQHQKPDCKTRLMHLKWGTTENPIMGKDLSVDFESQVASAEVKADGEWHEYEIDLSHTPLWCGNVNELWFEAVDLSSAFVDIDWMKFEPAAE